MKTKFVLAIFAIFFIYTYATGYVRKMQKPTLSNNPTASVNPSSPKTSTNLSSIYTDNATGITTYNLDVDIHKFVIQAPASWKTEGLFDPAYQQTYSLALTQQSVSFPIMNLSNPQLGFNQSHPEFPFNALIITAHKGGFATKKLQEFTNSNAINVKQVNYYPGFTSYEIESLAKENPADWMDDKNSPPPLKTFITREICVEISPNLVYEISYSIEKTNKYLKTIETYDQIISSIKFTDTQ